MQRPEPRKNIDTGGRERKVVPRTGHIQWCEQEEKQLIVPMWHTSCRSGHTISKVTGMENAQGLFFNGKSGILNVYSIILHDYAMLSGTSPRKANQNLLKQNKHLLVHVSEKPMGRATSRPGFIWGLSVADQCCPTEREREPLASSLQHVINMKVSELVCIPPSH